MLGMEEHQDLVGKDFFSFCEKASADPFYLHLRRVLKTRQSEQCELVLHKKDGTPFDVVIESVAVQDGKGNFNRCQSALIDITDRKRSEAELRQAHDQLEDRVRERTDDLAKTNEALQTEINERKQAEDDLRQSEEQFRLLVDGVKDYAIFMLDREGIVTSWNAGAQRIKGYAADQVIGQHFSRFYTPENIAAGKPERELAIATEQGVFSEESWRVRRDGSRFWASVTITSVRDEAGKLRGFTKVTRDITERKRADDALRESEARRNVAEYARRSD